MRGGLQALCKDARTVAAGGGSELEVAKQLAEHGRKVTGLEQYAYAKFAEALEVWSMLVLLVLTTCLKSIMFPPRITDLCHLSLQS